MLDECGTVCQVPFRSTNTMKSLIALTLITLIGWLAVVTFCGPELYRLINGPEPVKAAKVVRRAR